MQRLCDPYFLRWDLNLQVPNNHNYEIIININMKISEVNREKKKERKSLKKGCVCGAGINSRDCIAKQPLVGENGPTVKVIRPNY